jgi:hypothetical protein
VTPPGWPGDLPSEGSAFDEAVVGWLLDRLPPEYRTSPLRRHPAVLAVCACEHAGARLQAVREVYRGLRATMRDRMEQAEIDACLSALEALGAEFSRTLRESRLVREKVEGRTWRPRL